MNAYVTTGRDLGAALVKAATPAIPSAFDRRMADLEVKARQSLHRGRKAGARGFLKNPDRMARLVRGGEPTLERIALAAADHRNLGRTGHWCFNTHRMMALQEAEIALRYLRRFGKAVA